MSVDARDIARFWLFEVCSFLHQPTSLGKRMSIGGSQQCPGDDGATEQQMTVYLLWRRLYVQVSKAADKGRVMGKRQRTREYADKCITVDEGAVTGDWSHAHHYG